jgi:hypothetical protein
MVLAEFLDVWGITVVLVLRIVMNVWYVGDTLIGHKRNAPGSEFHGGHPISGPPSMPEME